VPAVRSVVIVGGGYQPLAGDRTGPRRDRGEVLEPSEDGNVFGIGMALQAPAPSCTGVTHSLTHSLDERAFRH
jgi:hypothetical protein